MLADLRRHSNGEVKITSWNVRGMNNPLKRGKVYAHLRALKSDIYFLQETHIKKTAVKINVVIIKMKYFMIGNVLDCYYDDGQQTTKNEFCDLLSHHPPKR